MIARAPIARGAVVAVVAHPDDEALIAGGTLALAAAAGTPTGVVALTRGELGPVAEGSLSGDETLPDARERELQHSAWALGVDWATCLRQPDGELAWMDVIEVARDLAEVLHRHGPAVILTFGEDGLYGHPDHVATRAIVLRTARLLSRAAPVVLEAAWAPETVPALVAAAAARGLPTGLWGLEPRDFGSPSVAPSATIDVRTVMKRKLRALRRHRTQLAADHLLAALPDDLAQAYLGEETWHGDADALDELRRLLEPAPTGPRERG